MKAFPTTAKHGILGLEVIGVKGLVLYASITGNAKGMARVVSKLLEMAKVDVTVGQMQQTDAETLKDYDIVVLATYTWSGGVIPEESQDFFADLEQTDYSQKPLVFGVVGTGDKYYGSEYNLAPDHFEKALTESGAIQGAPAIKIDQGVSEEEIPAFAQFVKQLIAEVNAVKG